MRCGIVEYSYLPQVRTLGLPLGNAVMSFGVS